MNVRFWEKPLQPHELSKELRGKTQAGAFVSFEGWVRDRKLDKKVLHLEYEAYTSMALKELEKIIAKTKSKFGIFEVALHHRVGVLKPGEIAVWVGVIGEHRKECFRACEYVMKELKTCVPIWKHEVYGL